VRPVWKETWKKKEEALCQRFHKSAQRLNENTRDLSKLSIGDRCYVQNQTENRIFLSKFTPESPVIKYETLGRVSPTNTCQARIIRTKTSIVAEKLPQSDEPLATTGASQLGDPTSNVTDEGAMDCPQRKPPKHFEPESGTCIGPVSAN